MADKTFEYSPPNLYGGLVTSVRADKIPPNCATILKNIDLRKSVARGGLIQRNGYAAGLDLTAYSTSIVTGAIYAKWGSLQFIIATLSTGELLHAADTGTYPL